MFGRHQVWISVGLLAILTAPGLNLSWTTGYPDSFIVVLIFPASDCWDSSWNWPRPVSFQILNYSTFIIIPSHSMKDQNKLCRWHSVVKQPDTQPNPWHFFPSSVHSPIQKVHSVSKCWGLLRGLEPRISDYNVAAAARRRFNQVWLDIHSLCLLNTFRDDSLR